MPVPGRCDAAARSRARARERFLQTEELAGDDVRAVILASWRRSQLAGVSVDRLEPRYADVDGESRLVHAAGPVLNRLESVLSGAPMSVILCDGNSRVLDRRAGEWSLNKHLDAILLAPGYSYAEEFVGTNGIGTAMEERKSAHVFGAEHFSERLQSVSCAGEPIRNPLSGRIEGVIDITCWSDDATPLMVALVQEAARDIERRLLEHGTERERALLHEFLAASRRANRPVLTLSDDMVITNATASHLLEPGDYGVLREQAAELMTARRECVVEVSLAQGRTARLRCRPVPSRSGPAGAVVEISISPSERDHGCALPQLPLVGAAGLAGNGTRNGKSGKNGSPGKNGNASRNGAAGKVGGASLIGLAGRSMSWTAVCRQVSTAARAKMRLLLVGESGVGKLAAAQGAHRRWRPAERLAVVDADTATDPPGAWLAEVNRQLAEPDGTLVLRHLHVLAPPAVCGLAGLLAARPDTGVWVVGTMRPAEEPSAGSLAHQFAASVTIPPLRHRMEDVRDLVPELIARMAPNRQVGCQPAVVRTLLRATWPDNVAGLQQALREALSRRRTDQITVEDLPTACHATSRRVLTEWEALERDAITRALLESGGDKVRAATRLGISRATIYRRISTYGIWIERTEPL